MPCCLVLVLLFVGPRLAILLAAIFTSFFEVPFDGMLLPILGFFFMPWTTLAYAWSINSAGEVSGFHLALIIVAVLVDLGLVGGGAAERRRRER